MKTASLRSQQLAEAARAKISWDQVFKTASSIRGQRCALYGDEFSGGCNIVYCIAFEDGIRWALRIPYDEMPLEQTVDTMRYVRSTVPEIPIAAVHAWSDSEDGDGIGTPYILLDWIEGTTLKWSASFPEPVNRGKILAQLAQYSAAFLTRTTTQPSTQSALVWMLRRTDVLIKRIFTGDLPSFDPIDCLIYRAMAEERYHIPSLDAFPFPLAHKDLGELNILIDDNFNITGILDWDDWACRLPLQCAVMCPKMICISNGPPFPDAALFRKDRLAFIDYFASAIAGSSSLCDLDLPSILADEELQLFHASIGSKGTYAYRVTKYSVRSVHWVKAAARALDKFILIYPEMANFPEVLSVRASILRMEEELE